MPGSRGAGPVVAADRGCGESPGLPGKLNTLVNSWLTFVLSLFTWALLGQPLVARVATVGRTGPSVRAVWYLREGRAFRWLTGGWSRLGRLLERDPGVALVVDTCDLDRGEVPQVTARGRAELHPFEADRARRWGRRYRGPAEHHWRRFQRDVLDDPTTRIVALEPCAPESTARGGPPASARESAVSTQSAARSPGL